MKIKLKPKKVDNKKQEKQTQHDNINNKQVATQEIKKDIKKPSEPIKTVDQPKEEQQPKK